MRGVRAESSTNFSIWLSSHGESPKTGWHLLHYGRGKFSTIQVFTQGLAPPFLPLNLISCKNGGVSLLGKHTINIDREVMKMELKMNYLCQSWQGFLQQLVYLISRGYYYYCKVEYPLQKEEKWKQIDVKLIKKYHCNKSKFQRSRLKNKGIANVYFIRYKQTAFILHTEGVFLKEILKDDIFYDCRNKKTRMTIPINTLIFTIMPPGDPNHNGVTVRLSKESYRDMKEHLKSVCQSRNRHIIMKEYDKINGIPAWGGMIKQKIMLADFTVKQAKKNLIKMKKDDLRINTRRKIYKVW